MTVPEYGFHQVFSGAVFCDGYPADTFSGKPDLRSTRPAVSLSRNESNQR